MQPAIRIFLTTFTNILLGAAVLIFAVGFFPHKASLPGLATWTENGESSLGPAPFDRVIFMVVDALRSDFVYGNNSNFHFIQSLIRSGAAIPFTGHASPPTITMPRIKAITTGSVPSFIDLVLNFAESDTSSTLATQDSWLAQIKAKPGARMVMYGDDTWLRLFPGFFERADGTTSFFVSDFTEVDNNVTRHIPDELAHDDWSAMVLHFLGLDHIGHKTGPRGPNMPAKQHEMDQIVKQIYEAMEVNAHLASSLLVLLGDHGMNEAGNHGANSAGEVSTALTFISPRFQSTFDGLECPSKELDSFRYYDKVDQSDVAPTLAALLGFPIPKNSLGAIIPKFLALWSTEKERYELLYQNARQIQQIAHATYREAFEAPLCNEGPILSDEHRLACLWTKIEELHNGDHNQGTGLSQDVSATQDFLREAQRQLSGTASQYDLSKMYAGIGLTLLALTISAATFGGVLLSNSFDGTAFIFVSLSYAFTMFASSYVEEEHQFWYWVSSAWLIILAIKQQRVHDENSIGSVTGGYTLICILFGVIRRWNQTGQKYAGEADLVTDVLQRSPWLLWTLILLTYLTVSRRLRSRPAEFGQRAMTVLPVLVAASAFLFKVAFTDADAPELLKGISVLNPVLDFARRYSLLALARIVFLGLGILVVAAFYTEQPWVSDQRRIGFLETIHDITTLFLITQSRTVNIPLFLLSHIQIKIMQENRRMQPVELVITSLLLQYSGFFAFGGTNAISSVDLSNAYNGVAGYNVLAVGILTFVSNWAGPIWWASATACVLRSNITTNAGSKDVDHFGILTIFTSVGVLAVMTACTVLREHLFIWTVFSPKYLYTMAWTFAQHTMVNGIYYSLITVGGYGVRG